MRRGRHLTGKARFWLAVALATALPGLALAQAPSPQPGWSLGLSLGGGWTSNPIESTRRVKGDASLSPEIALARRVPLWNGATLALTTQAASEFYAREKGESFNRVQFSAALTQDWGGFSTTISAVQRKSMSRDFSAHESASREVALAASRSITLAEGWTLIAFGRFARRMVEDGTEDQLRAGLNVTLVHRRGPWIARLGAGFGYTLEDKTLLLPRINTRSVSARFGLAYEWAADSEIGLRLAFTRAYSSYPSDRYKAYTLSPQISTLWRF